MDITGQLKNVPFKVINIGTGDTAIYNTVKKMSDIIVESSRNPYVRKWAEFIVKGVAPNDKQSEAIAIHQFVRNRTRYTNDPDGMEYLQTPPHVLQQLENNITPSLDCDDSTMLSLSLLKSVGFPVAIKVISTQTNGYFNHVYGLVKIKGIWTPIDCVKKDKPLGWQSPTITRHFINSLEGV